MKLAVLLSILALPLVIGACASSGRSLADAVSNTTWTMTHLDGRPIEADRPPTLQFDQEGHAGGFAGINRYSAAPTIGPGDELSFGPAAATKMAGPPELMRLESEFFDVLRRTRSATIRADTLTFLSADGEPLARFTR